MKDRISQDLSFMLTAFQNDFGFYASRKGVVLMSTYEEFIIILTIGLLIVAILNLKNKK